MAETAIHHSVQRPLSRVAEGRMAEIMGQRNRLGQILVQLQGAGNGAGNLRDLQRMRQTRPVMVAFRRQKHLRFVLEPSERFAMQHPIAIPLKRGTVIAGEFLPVPPLGTGRQGGIGRQYLFLDLFVAFPSLHRAPPCTTVCHNGASIHVIRQIGRSFLLVRRILLSLTGFVPFFSTQMKNIAVLRQQATTRPRFSPSEPPAKVRFAPTADERPIPPYR